MKRIAMTIAAATALGVVGLYGVHALAQGMGYGMGPGMMMGGQGPGWSRMMGAYDQGWFDALKKKLAITTAQEQAWNAYVSAAQANVQSMTDTHNSIDFDAVQKMAPKDQVDFMRKMHERRLDQMTTVLEARDTLFNVLDDKQKAIAQTAVGGYGMGFGGMMGSGGMPCFGQPPSPVVK
ncbi:Spy/CpxP family protein refolding chaperone [Magnetospirillum aberrantis]|uniref:Spy/CpxP family protein refolding chaperone n=1 Tax=Magnetospirillum aberrantis SpK TaxID=908842 RepID=A0A7C9QUK4_9PROT|nr:Spy/CpxP family protein refolding chaperone [Magnetospirillum aberrantis]NFV80998.1 Spy/CpxP family protein refolding chaperone [Magnetospirillum aberrantis SpK]